METLRRDEPDLLGVETGDVGDSTSSPEGIKTWIGAPATDKVREVKEEWHLCWPFQQVRTSTRQWPVAPALISFITRRL